MGTEESKVSGINNVSMDDLVWYVVVGILITLVVFALISTAGISKGSVEMRIMISVLVGIIFTISIVTSKAIKQRNDEAVQERALALTPAKQEVRDEDQGGEKRRESQVERKAKEEERGEEEEEEESDDDEEDRSDDDEEEELREAEEEEEEEEKEEKEGDDDAEAMGDDEEMEEAKKADADDFLNSRANPLAGYSRISAKAKLVARRRVKAAAEYLGREDVEEGESEEDRGEDEEEEEEEDELGEGEEESEHASKKRKKEKRDSRKSLNAQKRMLDELLTYEGLRRIEGSTLYAREAYKDHQVDEPGEGMDQRYVDPSLLTYDSEFAAYDDAYILNPRILSVNTPMAF
jgi:hypothetical protein